MNNKILLLIIISLFLSISAYSTTTGKDSFEGNLYQVADSESPIPTDVVPIDTKSVVLIPFGVMKPPTKESVEIARGVDVLLSYYLDFFYKFEIMNTAYVVNLLTDINLPNAPGLNEARIIAELAEADYVIFGNIHLDAPNIVLKGSWYDAENNEIMSYVEEKCSISMLLRCLTNFSRQLAYAPTTKFERSDLEKKAEERLFCKYINSFRFYVQAYMHYLRSEMKESEASIDKAILLEPDFVRALLFKADFLIGRSISDPSAVTAHLSSINALITQIENVKPETTGDFRLYWKLGQLVFRNGKLETMKAHDLFLKSYLLRSNWLPAYNDIIYDAMPALMTANKYYRNLDNIFKAAKDIQRIFPDNQDAKFVLAMIYWKLGQRDNAVEVLQEITESNTKYINAYRLLIQIKENKDPNIALEYAHAALPHHPFNYQLRYQTFIALFKTAFRGMDLDDDRKHITLDEIRRVNKRDLPNDKKYNIYKSFPFGFQERHFDKYDLNDDEMLDEAEFLMLLANYGYGPVERTKKVKDEPMTGINVIADELWHHALVCYALRGVEGPGIETASTALLKVFLSANPQALEKYYEYEKIYTEIMSDDKMSDNYDIDNPLSNLLIYWGLARNYKSYKSVAMEIGKKFIRKRDTLAVVNPKVKKEIWRSAEFNLFMYPNRTVEARFAPKNLPDYNFDK